MKYSLVVISLALLVSCTYSRKPETFSAKNISLQYPAWLFKTDDVYPSPNTMLQLKNDYRDVYFILIDHGMKPGRNGFQLMYDSVVGQLQRNIREPNIEKPDSTFVTKNDFHGTEHQVSGILSSRQQDHRFLFIMDVFEAPNGHIYQTTGWMLRHKRNLWTKPIQNAAYSLKFDSSPAH
jgi:hypothetical protein